MKQTVFELQKLSHDRFAEVVKEGAVALVAVGATEQHGYMPMGLDAYTAEMMQKLIGLAMERRLNVIEVPTLPFGASEHHTCYQGTISLGGSLFANVLNQLLRELYRGGIRLVAIINGHGGNEGAIAWAMKDAKAFCPGLMIHNKTLHYMVGPGDWRKEYPGTKLPESNHLSGELAAITGEHELSHADAGEASLLGVCKPNLLKAVQDKMVAADMPLIPDMTQVSGIRHPQQWFDTMKPGNGGKGDPRRATIAAVRIARDLMRTAASQTADDICKMWVEMKR